MNAIDPSIIKDEISGALYTLDGYTPTDAARGVFAAAEMKTTPYPMLPYAGLMHQQ